MADKISITICGDGGCGKSSITLRLVRSQWIHEYDPTIEDAYSVTRNIDGLPYFLSITDTAGQEEYRGLWTATTLKSDAFLLVYDITNPSSLETLEHFLELINLEAEQRLEDNERLRKKLGPAAGPGVGMPPPVKILAGNKCDLKDGRAISSRDGLEYARRHDCGFMETSAREMVNIEETFAHLVRRVVESRRVHSQGALARPPSRAGQSAHTTALPQTTRDASTKSKTRSWRFFGIGKSKDKMVDPDLDEKVCKVSKVSKVSKDSKDSKDSPATHEVDGEAQGCLIRRLCCGCC